MTSSQGLRPAKLLRVASLVRSSPLISAAFSFDRNDSKGTIAAIATSGSLFSSRLYSLGSNAADHFPVSCCERTLRQAPSSMPKRSEECQYSKDFAETRQRSSDRR